MQNTSMGLSQTFMKYSIACNEGGNLDTLPDCSKILPMSTRTRKQYQQRHPRPVKRKGNVNDTNGVESDC